MKTTRRKVDEDPSGSASDSNYTGSWFLTCMSTRSSCPSQSHPRMHYRGSSKSTGLSLICQMLIACAFLSIAAVAAAGAGEDIHHNLPDNLEIIDPKSLGLSGADLENFLGNVKLLPIDTFGGGNGGPKAQILTVGFDGNEQLNLEDFAQLSSDGLADSDKTVAEMAFKKFKDFFKNPAAAQNFDEAAQKQLEQEHRQAQASQNQPSAPPPTYASPFSGTGPTQVPYESSSPSGQQQQQLQHHEDNFDPSDHSPRTRTKKKRVRVSKRPVLFSSTFKSNNLDDEEYINEPQQQQQQHDHHGHGHGQSTDRPVEQFQDYVRVIQELQTKPPPISYVRNDFRNQLTQQYNGTRGQNHHQNHKYNPNDSREHQQQHQEPKPDFEPPQHFDQPLPTPPLQHPHQSPSPAPLHVHQQQQQQHHFGPATHSFPSPYFVAPSGPSVQPPTQQQHFPVQQHQPRPQPQHQPQPQPLLLAPVPSTSTSVHIQHHYDPVQEHGNFPQENQRQNNFVQQQQQQHYFPAPSPTAGVHSLPASIAPPPPPPQQAQYQPQQQFLDYRNASPAQNFLQPTPSIVREQVHYPSASSGPSSPRPPFDFSQHQHNRFHVPQQRAPAPPQQQYSNHGNNRPQHQQQQQQSQYNHHHQAQLPPPPQPPPPPPQSPQPTTTPRSFSPQGIFQVTPSVPMVPLATHENAMAAYRGHAERMKSFEMSGKQPYYSKNGGSSPSQSLAPQNLVSKPPPISIPSHPPQQQNLQQHFPPQHQQPTYNNNNNNQRYNNNGPPPPPQQNYFPTGSQSQHNQQQQNSFQRPPPPPPQHHAPPNSPGPNTPAFGGHLRLESQDYKQRVPSPHSHQHNPSGPGPSFRHPVPQPPDHHTRQQSTLGNLLAPMAQRIQALASRFMAATTSVAPPPPKHTMRRPPDVNFRGLPAFQDHRQPPSSGPERGIKFQSEPSTYHPIQFQKQFAHVNFRQHPIPSSSHSGPGPSGSASQQFNSNSRPYYKTEQHNHNHGGHEQHKRDNSFMKPSQPISSYNPQAAQLKPQHPQSGAVVIHNKSNNHVSAPSPSNGQKSSSFSQSQSQSSSSTSLNPQFQHQEANTYAKSLGLHVQSITTAPLISAFTVKTPAKY